MHRNAPNCTYIEDKVDLSIREINDMYKEAFRRGYQEGQAAVKRPVISAHQNLRDFRPPKRGVR